MSKFKDETGKKYDFLTVIKYKSVKTKSGRMRIYWDCKCDCGGFISIESSALRRKDRFHSCGCYSKMIISKCNSTHKLSGTRVYRSWNSAKQRCRNPKDTNYHNYGGRGIKMSKEWDTFENFLRDMGYPPDNNHTIERIDVNGNYEKNNCKWATPAEKARNRRNSRFYEYQGKKMILKDWANELNVNEITLRYRIKRGWPIEKIFDTKNYNYKDESKASICHQSKPD